MTANYFSPASPTLPILPRGSDSGIPGLSGSIHNRDMAVIIDVVYNHVGEPAHLLFVDKRHFHLEPDGS